MRSADPCSRKDAINLQELPSKKVVYRITVIAECTSLKGPAFGDVY